MLQTNPVIPPTVRSNTNVPIRSWLVFAPKQYGFGSSSVVFFFLLFLVVLLIENAIIIEF